MKPRRLLILGRVGAPVQTATKETYPELTLDVDTDGHEAPWRVQLATPEVEAEAREIGQGAAVAFAGWTYGDDKPTLKADGVLVLREVAPEVLASEVPALAPFTSRQALDAMLDKVERLAIAIGMGTERARIAAIMNSPEAVGSARFAWKVAESGLSVTDSLETMRVSRIASACPPVDAGAALSH